MTILEKYNSAKKFTKVCPKQKAIFKWWKTIKVKPPLGCDTETTGLRFGLPTYLGIQSAKKGDPIIVQEKQDVVVFGISLAVEKNGIVNLFWGRVGSPLYRDILKLLKVKGTKAFHNARYDIRACEVSGIKLAGELECTYTMSRIYWDRRKKHSLQKLGEILCPELSDWELPIQDELKRLQREYKKEGYDKDYVNFSFIDDKMMSEYAMTDAFMALMLYQYLHPTIDNDFHELYEREKQVLHIINKVEKRGLAFDIPKAKVKLRTLEAKMRGCEKRICSLVGEHNLNSPIQVLTSLIASGVPRKMLILKGKLTTGADVLRRALHQLPAKKKTPKKYIENLLLYRSYAKTVGTYLKPLIERASLRDGIIYCSINPADSRTGRMASRDPNLQNIPEPVKRQTGQSNPVRSCFIVRPGYVNYYFDYSQFEMVIFGLYAQEELILDSYNRGEDIHGNMAAYIYGKKYNKQQRDLVKNLSYGKIYGLGVRTMALMYNMSEAEAKDYLKQYDREFPAIREFQYLCKEELQQYGYVIDWFGKRYHVPVPQAYKAVNCLVQGSCASIFKIALVNIDEVLDREDEHILLPVHDEFQIEGHPYSRQDERLFIDSVVGCMIGVPEVVDKDLTLKVDVSKSTTNWAEKERVKNRK